MERVEDPMVGTLLAALVHDALQPISAAILLSGAMQRELRHLSRMLDRTDRSFRALRWLSQALRFPAEAHEDRQPCQLIKALDAVRKKTDQLAVDVAPEWSVLAAPCVPEVVLETLLRNTRRYARNCNVLVRARVNHEGGKRFIYLTVQDDGPGMSAATQAQLFDPAAVTEGGGLGVGLWLAQLMVRANGGDLWLDDTARGSSFTSRWPYAVTPASDGYPTDPREFGRAVRAAREAAGLTRLQLSGPAGIATETIRNIETARHRPNATTRARLLRALSFR